VSKLNIRAEETPHGTIIKIGGEVTVEEVDEMERQLQAMVERPAPVYVLDLSGLSFAASLAIGALLRFRNQAISTGARVALADVQPMINDSFRRAQLHRVFSIYPTVDEAFDRTAVS
jgi:anti-anti-sigma factor